MQNWNDGKSQEYKDRKVYNAAIAAKREFATSTISNAPAAECSCESSGSGDAKVTLFTTTTCPNCRIAKRFLDDAGIEYEVVVADQDEAKAREYQISHAPTLVISNGKDAEKLPAEAQNLANPAAPAEEKLILFTTTTCPNCRMAKDFLDQASKQYSVVVSDQDKETAKSYTIRQAPTLVVDRGDDFEKIVGLSEIRRYLESK